MTERHERPSLGLIKCIFLFRGSRPVQPHVQKAVLNADRRGAGLGTWGVAGVGFTVVSIDTLGRRCCCEWDLLDCIPELPVLVYLLMGAAVSGCRRFRMPPFLDAAISGCRRFRMPLVVDIVNPGCLCVWMPPAGDVANSGYAAKSGCCSPVRLLTMQPGPKCLARVFDYCTSNHPPRHCTRFSTSLPESATVCSKHGDREESGWLLRAKLRERRTNLSRKHGIQRERRVRNGTSSFSVTTIIIHMNQRKDRSGHLPEEKL